MKKYLVLVIFLTQNFLFAGFRFKGSKGSLNLNQTNSTLSLENNITGFSGTLKLRTASADNIKTSSSKTIGFSGGSIQVDNNVIDLTGGTYDPKASGTDEMILQNGNILSISAGSAVQHIVSVASLATASIIGTPNFSSAVVVGSGATLNLGLRHKLGQNITLGVNSTMVLTDDLSLQDGIKFDGTGVSGGTAVVDLTKHSLEIGSSGAASAWTGTINFKRAQDIQINGPISLSGTWNFITDGTDKQSVLNGNGNVLDLAGGGTIQVGSDHTLFISDLTIKNFGTGAGTFNLANSATTPGTVVLSNVTLELSANYTHAAGLIIVRGDNVRVIVGKSAGGAPYTFTLDVLNSAASTEIETLNIDGQVLIYETLGGDNTMPFYKLLGSGAGQGALSLSATGTEVATNGGVIRSAISNVASIDTTIDAVANNGSTVTLTSNYNLFTNATSPGTAPTGRIVVTNSAAPTAKTVTIDGSNYFWQFPGGTYDVLKIAEGVTVTLQNVVLKDFSLDNVEFVHATTSVLKFGDGVVISIGRDNDLPIGTRGLTFSGNATILGNGRTLRLTSASNIVQSGAGKTLTIAKTNLKLENATALTCTDPAAKIKLLSSKLLINQAGWTIGTGSLDIGERVYFDSTVSNVVNGQSLVDFTTTGTLTVGSAATLVLGRNINFQYRPNPANNANTQTPVYFARRHLVLADKSSTLLANGCTITSTATAFSLDYGNLLVDNEALLSIASGTGCDVEFTPSVNIEILACANLIVDGKVSYLPGQADPYFTVFGPSISSAKYGVTDPVTLQAITDAYSKGFKVVGSTTSDWLYTAVAVLDTSTSYTSDPEIMTLRATDGAVSHIKLKDASRQTYSGGVVGHKSCDISVDGYFSYSDSSDTGYSHQSPRPLFNIAGKRSFPFVSAVARASFDVVLCSNPSYDIFYNSSWSTNLWFIISGIQCNSTVSTIDGTVDFQAIAIGSDSTIWRVDKTSGNLIKREANNSEATVTLPSGFSGTICCVSAKGTTSTNYLAIASSTGQAYIKKDNGSWTNLDLSGVVKIAVGLRGTIAILIKHDSAVHGTLFPLLVKAGI